MTKVIRRIWGMRDANEAETGHYVIVDNVTVQMQSTALSTSSATRQIEALRRISSADIQSATVVSK